MLRKIAVAFVAVILLSSCNASTGRYGDSNKHIVRFERQIGDKVFFSLNSSNLSSEARNTLMRQAKWLGERKLFNIIVEGHCDERGTREYNIALGERRANAVKKFLIKCGIDASRIDTLSYGKERPAVVGNNEDAWKSNRRSVTTIR